MREKKNAQKADGTSNSDAFKVSVQVVSLLPVWSALGVFCRDVRAGRLCSERRSASARRSSSDCPHVLHLAHVSQAASGGGGGSDLSVVLN